MKLRASLVVFPMLVISVWLLASSPAEAIPVFARKYGVSCNLCHVAFPRLNSFGEDFAGQNMRLDNWREAGTIVTGDDRLVLPAGIPFAIRAQGYAQIRQGKNIDPETGPTDNDSEFDLQSPYLIKLLSSAPLSEHVTYYFYGIFAEKGGNGEALIEDAWFSYYDLLGSGVNFQFGQFQISDLMFPREVRLTFQDFLVYRMAGITYDRIIQADKTFGPVSVALGVANGNGITDNFDVNSPGFERPDNMFDNDTDKSFYGRIGLDLGLADVGFFGLTGRQKNATGPVGADSGGRDTVKLIGGVDVSGDIDQKIFWYVQFLWSRWKDFITDGRDYDWYGGFAGVDYVMSDKVSFSVLYNINEAHELEATGTVYEGIDMNTLTLNGTYYLMTNLKAVVEGNIDFLAKDSDADFVGHETREGYLLVGLDAAF